MFQKMHIKHTNTPKTPTKSPRCGGRTQKTSTKNTSTPMGTINGSSPILPTQLVWVGWEFCLGLGVGVGVGHFVFTVILVHVFRIQ